MGVFVIRADDICKEGFVVCGGRYAVCIALLLGIDGYHLMASNSIRLAMRGKVLFAKPLHDCVLTFSHGGGCNMDDSR